MPPLTESPEEYNFEVEKKMKPQKLKLNHQKKNKNIHKNLNAQVFVSTRAQCNDSPVSIISIVPKKTKIDKIIIRTF